MKLKVCLVLTVLLPFFSMAQAEELSLSCNGKKTIVSLQGVVRRSDAFSWELKIDLQSEAVSGFESTWKDGGIVTAEIDSSTIKIIDAPSSSDRSPHVITISRTDGTLKGESVPMVFEGICTKAGARTF